MELGHSDPVQLNKMLGPLNTRKKKGTKTMSTIALLNKDGTFRKKLHLTSLPENYVVPEGTIVSWKMSDIIKATMDSFKGTFGKKEPLEANFYLGSAWAQVRRISLPDDSRSFHGYGRRQISAMVQGTNPKDINKLRDHVLMLIQTDQSYESSNDLNPKPKKLRWWQKLLKSA